MTNILLVADNHIFIRRIYELLCDMEEYNINISFSSSGIFEAYLLYRSEVVILDSASVLPIESVMKQFDIYHWKAGFIIVGGAHEQTFFSKQIAYAEMEQESLRRALMLFAARTHLEPTPSAPPSFSQSLTPDTYSLLLAIRTENRGTPPDTVSVQQLRWQLEVIGIPERLAVSGVDILVLMKKSTMRTHGAFAQVHKVIAKALCPQYAALYCENLRSEELEATCLEMQAAAPLCCCIGNNCLSLSQLHTAQAGSSAKDGYREAVDWLEALVLNKPRYGTPSYLAEIKRQLDLESYTALRYWLGWLEDAVLIRQEMHLAPKPMVWQLVDSWYAQHTAGWERLATAYSDSPLLPAVRDAVLLILRSYSEPALSLEGIAEQLGFSKAYLSRIFRQQMGSSLVTFLQQLRMAQACWLICRSNRPIKEIAAIVGYPDAQYFSKLFWRYLGSYPTDYRKQHRKDDQYAGTCPQPSFAD